MPSQSKKCALCNGKGSCHRCGGAGDVRTEKSGFRICPECDGSKKCAQCGSTGFVKREGLTDFSVCENQSWWASQSFRNNVFLGRGFRIVPQAPDALHNTSGHRTVDRRGLQVPTHLRSSKPAVSIYHGPNARIQEMGLKAALAITYARLRATEQNPGLQSYSAPRLVCPELPEFTHQRVRQENVARPSTSEPTISANLWPRLTE